MAYIDKDIPVIEKITLPSGNTYYIADREIRDVVDTLSQTIAGGVSYTIAWDGASTPVVGSIPAGVKVTYNGTTYTGTMTANSATPGSFYLVKSSTQVDGKDIYDEYVPVGPDGSKSWEKIGDTQVDLADIVTDVTLNQNIVNAITNINPTTENAVKSVTPTTKKLATASQNIVASRTSQTTADGTGTASTTNTDWLKGVSVSNGVLTIGAATMDTQTTYSAGAPTAVTIATGATTTSGSGADVVTGVSVGDTFNAITSINDVATSPVLTSMTDITVIKGSV